MTKKILLVDDSETALLMERRILRSRPWELVVAHDGAEALDKARAEKPDVIVMDVVMPRMGGFEACQRLRESDDTRDIPIILVTTRGEPENVETGFRSGCSDYVTKPINSLELLSKLSSYLD